MIKIVLLIPLLLFAPLLAFAQEERLEPFQVYEKNYVERDIQGRIPSETIYDVYGRAISIEQILPLSYIAITEYEYFDYTFLVNEKYYESRVKTEKGFLLNKDGDISSSYEIEFDENMNIVSKTSTGGKFLRSVLIILVKILGVDLGDEEENWISNRFDS